MPKNPENFDHRPSFPEKDPWCGVDGLGFWLVGDLLPSLGSVLKTTLGITSILYILNQKHLLPRPVSAVVSKVLFWPTLPITFAKRWENWYDTVVNDKVMLGGAPFGFMGIPERLHEDYGVGAVINMCEEYKGPVKEYSRLGMKQLWLPTTDHFEPSVGDLAKAVDFIQRQDTRVYVHCRAGHGRSAAVVLAWMMATNDMNKTSLDEHDVQDLNRQLCCIRNVRKGLWKQPNIQQFRALLVARYEKSRSGT